MDRARWLCLVLFGITQACGGTRAGAGMTKPDGWDAGLDGGSLDARDAGFDASSRETADASSQDAASDQDAAAKDAGRQSTPEDSGIPPGPPAVTSCGAASDFLGSATWGTTGIQTLSGDLVVGALAELSGSCGGSRRERVYMYRAPARGYLQARVESSEATLVLHLRTICDDASSEAACVSASRDTGLGLESGQTAFAIVDTGSDASDGSFTLALSFLQERGVGATCDPTGVTTYCASGLRCETRGDAAGTCVTNTAPTLSSASVLTTGRSGGDLFISVSGSDAEADVTGLGLSPRLSTGQAVLFAGRNAQGAATDAAGVVAFDRDLTGEADFSATFTWRGFFTQFESVTSVEVWLVDSGALSSERRSAQVSAAPVLAGQQPCDASELANVCDTGFLCTGTPRLCRAGAAPTLDTLAYLRLADTDARLMVAATDPDRDLVWATVEFESAQGVPVQVDADHDGTLESTLSFPVVQTEPGAAGFFEVDLTGIESTAPRLSVELSDWSGLRSARRSVSLADQPEIAESGACDVRRKLDRCAPSLACAGEPTASCVPGSPPSWERSAYLRSGAGVVLYLEARDLQRDVDRLKLEYLDAQELALVVFDTDGDDRADASSRTAQLTNLTYSEGARFFLPVRVPVLDVPKLAVTLIDRADLESPRVVLALANRSTRAENATCSVHGFDVCASGTLCLAEENAQTFDGVCTLAQTAQQSRCTVAATVDYPGTLIGQTGTASLWDPPSYCADAAIAQGKPEGVVRLSLNQTVSLLRISTDTPGTNFDSILYVLPDCGTDGVAPALGCHDDVDLVQGNLRSTVTLTDVGPGDFLIIVDSADPTGGRFELTVGTP